MALIEELYKPRIGLVPVGDRFTMSGDTAALAVQRFFKFDHIVPMHYGTFPIIDQTPDRFIEAMGDQRTKIVAPKPGQNGRGVSSERRKPAGRRLLRAPMETIPSP
jgi:L-ascorbate metabolism protein UlaG (beta-lactamase superfamily)